MLLIRIMWDREGFVSAPTRNRWGSCGDRTHLQRLVCGIVRGSYPGGYDPRTKNLGLLALRVPSRQSLSACPKSHFSNQISTPGEAV